MSVAAASEHAAATAVAPKPERSRGNAPALSPAILHGRVGHRRSRPRGHAFEYAAFMLRIPLSTIAALTRRGLRIGRRGLVTFDPRDHGDGVTALSEWVRGAIASHGIAAAGEIVLYAFPRMLGYGFRPVSFYVCHDVTGNVQAVVAEVNNTFGERHHYVLADPSGGPLCDGTTLTAGKALHVSPFCAVRGRYAFRFSFGADRWLARIDYHDGDDDAAPLIETWISGTAAPLDQAAVRRLPLRYGWFTAAVIVRIHWQAVRLWVKRVPWYRKPAAPARAATPGFVATESRSADGDHNLAH